MPTAKVDDDEINSCPIPERLQEIYGRSKRVFTKTELDQEAHWIYQKLKRRNEALSSDPEAINKIVFVLDQLKNQYFEVIPCKVSLVNRLCSFTPISSMKSLA